MGGCESAVRALFGWCVDGAEVVCGGCMSSVRVFRGYCLGGAWTVRAWVWGMSAAECEEASDEVVCEGAWDGADRRRAPRSAWGGGGGIAARGRGGLVHATRGTRAAGAGRGARTTPERACGVGAQGRRSTRVRRRYGVGAWGALKEVWKLFVFFLTFLSGIGMARVGAEPSGPDISRGRWISCRFSGFSGVGAIVALFVPTGCSGGRGMWGIFGNTFLKWRFLADFKKYTHPPPPPPR